MDSNLVKDMEAFIQLKTKMDEMQKIGKVTSGSYEFEFLALRELTLHFKVDKVYTTTEGEKPLNTVKNRYKDIMPYDHTRVKLNRVTDGSSQDTTNQNKTDYINASHITGVVSTQTYIAAQGPLPGTAVDFWDMIWQYNVRVVVMACNEIESGKLRCKRYWPVDTKEELKFGDITVTLMEERLGSFKEYVIRYMRACREGGGGVREVIQIHYTAWPDRGVPQCIESLWELIETLRLIQPLTDDLGCGLPPVVVHCSAGCGRTGTILVLDYVRALLKFGKLNNEFNLYKIIADMRKQRMAIVQSQEQYVFVHDAVADLFTRQLGKIQDNFYENYRPSNTNSKTSLPDPLPPPNNSHYSIPSPPPSASTLPRLPSKTSVRSGSLKKHPNGSGESHDNKNVVRSGSVSGQDFDGSAARVSPPENFNLIDFANEYRAPPQAPPPGPYREPQDSRLMDDSKPQKINNIWSEPRLVGVGGEVGQVGEYSEVKVGSVSSRSSESGIRKNSSNKSLIACKKSSHAAEKRDPKTVPKPRSPRNSLTSGDSREMRGDSGYYSYANPEAGQKWSLQDVARYGKPGPDGDANDPGYATVAPPLNGKIQSSNKSPDSYEVQSSTTVSLPERKPIPSTSDDSNSAGKLGFMFQAKQWFTAKTNRNQEPVLQVSQPSARLAGGGGGGGVVHVNSFHPERVMYGGKNISYPHRIGKPKGKRPLIEKIDRR